MVNGSCNIIRNLLYTVIGISHGYTDIAVAEHIKVILAIAKSYSIFLTHTESIYDICYAGCFVYTCKSDLTAVRLRFFKAA